MNWYIRRQNKVTGPFPVKQLQQSILLGRLSLHDEVSKNREEWLPVRTVAELIPEILKADTSDPATRERLAAARRWADERRGERRDTADGRLGPGRREPENHGTLEYRFQREAVLADIKKSRDRLLGGAVLAIVILAAIGFAGFRFIPEQQAGAQCDAVPASGVNWSNCNRIGEQLIKVDLSKAQLTGTSFLNTNLFGADMSGANLSYANLTQAKLDLAILQNAQAKGANFTGATLANANLTNADLSYAIFKQAKLENANLSGANLVNAIWIDGKTCIAGSVGKCVTK